MGLWAFTAAYCGPAVLKYPLKYLLLPEVSFRFQMRRSDILKVLRVVTLVLCVKKSQSADVTGASGQNAFWMSSQGAFPTKQKTSRSS